MFSDDLSLLSTGYIPSAYELHLISARVREQRQELLSIDIKIASLGQQLDDLRRHRAYVDRSYSVAQSLVAPIRRLPLDILREIFAQSIPRLDLDSLEGDTSEDPLDAREPHPHDARSALRCVCRRWRQVVDATPSLWSTFALDHRLPYDIRVVERWLSRSEGALIDVYIHPSVWSENYYHSRFQAVLFLIQEHLPHIRLLIVHLRHYRALVNPSLALLTDLFPVTQCTEAPNMEVFGIIGDLEAELYETVGPIHAPKLSSLILLDSETTIRAFTQDSLLSLQRLTMSLSSRASEAYFDILAQCSNLRSLHWADYSDIQQHSTGPDGSFSPAHPLLPSLTSLILRVEVSAETLPLFKHLHGSTLDTISIDASPTMDNRPPLLDALASLINDEVAHVSQLMIMRASVGPGMAGIFACLPNLTTLHVSACELEAPFFSSLVSQSHTPVCPRLETLRIHSCHFSVSDLAFFLGHRAESTAEQPHSSGCLTCVEIIGCNGILQEEEMGEILSLQSTYHHIITLIES